MKKFILLLLLAGCTTPSEELQPEKYLYECVVQTSKGAFSIKTKTLLTKKEIDVVIAKLANDIHNKLNEDELIYECHTYLENETAE